MPTPCGATCGTANACACGTEPLKLDGVGSQASPARRVLRLTERTTCKHGNPLLLPAYELEGWTSTLPARFTMQEIIDLCKEHATHEQFHSEFKTDMDLERLPSGKFDTNFLVCTLAAAAMNILRLTGRPKSKIVKRQVALRRSVRPNLELKRQNTLFGLAQLAISVV